MNRLRTICSARSFGGLNALEEYTIESSSLFMIYLQAFRYSVVEMLWTALDEVIDEM